MKISTFSIVAGSAACNARCPFCVAHLTPANGMTAKPQEVNWRNFKKACRLAQLGGVTTAMLTGKGEPTLFPDQITDYLRAMEPYDFPLIELQTNAIQIGDHATRGDGGKTTWDDHLHRWHGLGLTTIAVSVVHYDDERNRSIYAPYRKDYPALARTINLLHCHGYSVRLTVTMLKGFVDSAKEALAMAWFAKKHHVEQLTIRPVARPDEAADKDMAKWVAEHAIPAKVIEDIDRNLSGRGTLLMELPHGAKVYDVEGQNVCITDCLVVKPDATEMRNLIFFPDGSLRYAWQYEGARLL